MKPLISARELAGLLGEPYRAAGLVLLDVRWSLGRSDGRERYAAGHLPSAVYVDLDSELSAAPGPGTGRHPLPLPQDFEAAARRWGLNADDTVVAYDDAGGLSAARAWWLLRHAGFENVAVLDGGLDAWRALPGAAPLSTGEESPAPGTVSLSWGRMPVIEFEDLASFAGTLIDSRATARYLGIDEPVDPIAGHIPGARNRPTTDNLDAQAFFHAPEALRAEFERLGAADGSAAAYCGSGITAAHQVLAAASAGIELGLYPGGWSEYVAHPGVAVATSDEQHRR